MHQLYKVWGNIPLIIRCGKSQWSFWILSLLLLQTNTFQREGGWTACQKICFGLEGSYKQTKSNCSNMLGWNELHFWKVSRVLSQTWRKVINDCFALLPACYCMGPSKSSRFDYLKLSLELDLFILDHPLIYHSRPFSVHVASLFR